MSFYGYDNIFDGLSIDKYATALVCLNGHVKTDNYENSGECAKFCGECGAELITQCPSCNAPIRGELLNTGVVVLGFTPRTDKFCYNCGKPYPWTIVAIESAKELAEESEELDQADIEKLETAMADIMVDTPKTEVAVMRIKKIVSKAGEVVGPMLQKVATDIASETAKKMLLG